MPGTGRPGDQATLHPLLLLLASSPEEALDLEARRALFDQVESYPGIHLSELARETGLTTNHAKYHLEVLEDHRLISSRKEDGYWRFFPTTDGSVGRRDVLSREEKTIMSLLRREVPLNATVVLLDEGRATLSELAERVGVAASTLHYHLGRMEDGGLVVSEKDGRKRYFWVDDPDLVMDLLIRYKPPDSLVEGFLGAWEQLEL